MRCCTLHRCSRQASRGWRVKSAQLLDCAHDALAVSVWAGADAAVGGGGALGGALPADVARAAQCVLKPAGRDHRQPHRAVDGAAPRAAALGRRGPAGQQCVCWERCCARRWRGAGPRPCSRLALFSFSGLVVLCVCFVCQIMMTIQGVQRFDRGRQTSTCPLSCSGQRLTGCRVWSGGRRLQARQRLTSDVCAGQAPVTQAGPIPGAALCRCR